MPHCIICNKTVPAWVPHPLKEHVSEFTRILRAVGSDLNKYQCPACGCNDRDRHLWLFMNAANILPSIQNFRVLHIAPEHHIEILISKLEPVEYIRGDLYPQKPGHLKIDIENIAFEDGRFNLIICNHVLEHVSDPLKALRQLHRCLSPQGTLIAQTPYSPLLKNTFEINEPASPEFAKLFFGQDDHQRLFGSDIAAYFEAAGFQGIPIANEVILGHLNDEEFGFNAREPFFAFSK